LGLRAVSFVCIGIGVRICYSDISSPLVLVWHQASHEIFLSIPGFRFRLTCLPGTHCPYTACIICQQHASRQSFLCMSETVEICAALARSERPSIQVKLNSILESRSLSGVLAFCLKYVIAQSVRNIRVTAAHPRCF
jgi:hypothetical protein